MRYKIFFAILIVLSVSLSACGKEEPSKDTASSKAVPLVVEPIAETVSIRDLKVMIIPESPRVSDALTAVVSGSNGRTTYQWKRNGESLARGEETVPAYSAAKADVISVTVISGEETSTATVLIANTPPEIISLPFEDPYVVSGKPITVNPEGVDADNDELTYRYVWTVNDEELFLEEGPKLSGERVRKGDRISLRVVPNDGEDDGKEFRGAEFTVPNSPPVFLSEPSREFLGHEYHYQPVASDPDGDPLAFRLESGPAAMTINEQSGEILWMITQNDAGDHLIRIVAEDPDGMSTIQEYTLTLTIAQ